MTRPARIWHNINAGQLVDREKASTHRLEHLARARGLDPLSADEAQTAEKRVNARVRDLHYARQHGDTATILEACDQLEGALIEYRADAEQNHGRAARRRRLRAAQQELELLAKVRARYGAEQ